MQLHPGGMSCGFNLNYTLSLVGSSNITHTIPVQCVPPKCSYEFPVGEGVVAPVVFNCSIKDYTEEIQICNEAASDDGVVHFNVPQT